MWQSYIQQKKEIYIEFKLTDSTKNYQIKLGYKDKTDSNSNCSSSCHIIHTLRFWEETYIDIMKIALKALLYDKSYYQKLEQMTEPETRERQ